MATTLTADQLAKLTKLSQLQSLAARTKSYVDGLDSGNVKSVGLSKDSTAADGYAASYTLTINGDALETKINIPKDYLVKSATLETVSAADKGTGGKFASDNSFAEGDKYIDFVVNTKADGDNDTETDAHIYLNVKDLVDVYTNGSGLNLSGGAFSVKIDSTNANGLDVTSSGVKLGVATDSVAGAMSATDHAQFTADSTKLSGISSQANKTTVTTEGAGTIEIDGTSRTVVNIAADADVTTMLNEELPLS